MTSSEAGSNLLAPDFSALKAEPPSGAVVEILFTTAKEQVAADERRLGLLLTKANALLGVAGLSLTVAFTFGGLVLQRPELHATELLVVYALAVLGGLVSAGCAMFAMWVRNAQVLAGEDLFNLEAVRSANRQELEVGDGGAGAFKLYLCEAYWKVYRKNVTRTQRVSTWILLGQVGYSAFLVLILIAGCLLANVARPDVSGPLPANIGSP